MKLKIAVIAALSLAIPTQACLAGKVNPLIQFKKNNTAVATEVNKNFTDLKTAVDDNFELIEAHKNTLGSAHGGNSAGTGTAGNVSDGGDGSAGPLLIEPNAVTQTINWSTLNHTNLNFTTCTFGNVASLNSNKLIVEVPSGLTIRCQGAVAIHANATIQVGNGFGGGVSKVFSTRGSSGFDVDGQFPIQGVGAQTGLVKDVIYSSLDVLPMGGAGNQGAGYFQITSNVPIVIDGIISANGRIEPLNRNGGGGAAGGIIVIESLDSIDLTNGAITANGSNGGGGGQGGGGGIIVLVATNGTTGANNITALPGVTGPPGGSVETPIGYDGGGACGGNGGGVGGVPTAGFVVELKKRP